MLSDEFNYNSEKFSQFVQKLYIQFATILQFMQDLPEIGRISIEKIGNTEAGVEVFYGKQKVSRTMWLISPKNALGEINSKANTTSKLSPNSNKMPVHVDIFQQW